MSPRIYYLEYIYSEDVESYLGDNQLNYLTQDVRKELKKEIFLCKS